MGRECGIMSQKDDSLGGGLNVPQGLEVLIKKAAVDPEFKEVLLAERSAAAGRISLVLEPAEAAMLAAAPVAQLEAIIARTVVPQEHRRVFLGQAAAAMLATVAIMSDGCNRPKVPPAKTTGIRPDFPKPKPEQGR
jgi:hypothetical protein